MNTVVSKNPNSRIDIMTDSFGEYLKSVFPNMTDKVLYKNLGFYRLLDDYSGKSINGIDKFLSKNGYNSEGNKMLNNFEDIINKLTDQEKEEILKGNLLIGTKLFIYLYENEVKDMNYIVLASKKDNPIIKEAKSFFQNLFTGVFGVKNN